MIKNRALYDVLKYLALVVFPALGTLYFALSQIWGLPAGADVVGSITAFDTFLGVTLHLSTVQYNKSDAKYDGAVDVVDTPEKKTYTLSIHGDVDQIDKQPHLLLKVNTPPLPSPPRS